MAELDSEPLSAYEVALRERDKFSSIPNAPSYGAITAVLTRQLDVTVAMSNPQLRHTDLGSLLDSMRDDIYLANDTKPSDKIDSEMEAVRKMVCGSGEAFHAMASRLLNINVLAVSAEKAANEAMLTVDDEMDTAPKDEMGDEGDFEDDLELLAPEQMEPWGDGDVPFEPHPMEMEEFSPMDLDALPHEVYQEGDSYTCKVIKDVGTQTEPMDEGKNETKPVFKKRAGLRKIKNEMMDDDEEEVMDAKPTIQKRSRSRKIKNEMMDDDEEEVMDVKPTIQKRARTRKIKNEIVDDLDGRPLIPHSKLITIRKIKTEPIDEVKTSSRTIKKTEKAMALVKVKREPLTCVVTGADCFVCKKRIVRTLRGYTDHLSKHKVVLRTSDYYLLCSCGEKVYATMEARSHQNVCNHVGDYCAVRKGRSSKKN